MRIGAEVRRRRKALGLTLESLAERSGLSPHYLSTLETGKRDPSVSTVVALAGALGASPGELLGQVKGLSPAGAEAGRLLDASPPEVQEGVLRILRAVARRSRRT